MCIKGNKSVAPRRDRSMWKCNYDAQTNRLLTDRITSDQQKNQPTNRQTDRIIGKLRLILTAMKRNERTILPPRYVYSLNTLSLIGFIIPIAKVYLNRQQSWNCWNCCWHKTAAVAFSSFSLLRQTYRTHAKCEAFDKLSLSPLLLPSSEKWVSWIFWLHKHTYIYTWCNQLSLSTTTGPRRGWRI